MPDSSGGIGYRRIAQMFRGYGLAEQGIKDVRNRLKDKGAPRSAGAEENVEATRSVMEGGKDATRGGATNATDMARSAVRRIMKRDLALKPVRKIKGRRVEPCGRREEDGILP